MVPSFDGFRAFAILGVVAIHVILSAGVSRRAGDDALGQVIWGTVGQAVDALFIVSGFVVFLPTVARGGFGNVGDYAIRRAARIAPAYWMVLAITLILMALRTPAGLTYPTPASIGAHVGFLQTPAGLLEAFTGWRGGYGFGVDIPVWTLSVEMAFYFVLPFVAAAYLRRPLAGLALCALIAVGWRELFDHLGAIVDFFGGSLSGATAVNARFAAHDQLPFWAFSFALGMTSAWAYVELRRRLQPERLSRLAGRFQLLAALGVVVFVYLAGHYATKAAPPFTATLARQTLLIGLGYSAATAAFMLTTALASDRRQMPFSAGPIRRLGDISYGVYLSHYLIAVYVAMLLSPPTDGSLGALALWAVIVVPLAILYGYLSARYLEIPIRRWARSRGRRGEVAAVAGTGPGS